MSEDYTQPATRRGLHTGRPFNPAVSDAPTASEQLPSPNSLDIHSRRGTALQADPSYNAHSGDEFDREERCSLRRVGALEVGVEREEGVDIEYRQVRLERVVLVGLWQSGELRQAEESLRELAALAETAGSEVLDGLIQHRSLPDPATYLGQGKAHELADLVAVREADTVIVDSELAPSQRRALEDIVKVKVIDRTALILDIFARHAKSKEGKAQVELAQLEYLLPRLRGWGESMSRQAGGRVAAGAGIGSRGPGETQIELDRRRIRTRMAKLRRDIKRMAPGREQRRAERRRTGTPSVVVVGYTNAGKSSLLNRLTGAGVLVENALFATLDPTVRQATTPSGRAFTITDTVGFVRNLPTQLVEAFRSTLEEAGMANVLLHVVDSSHPDPVGQVQAVHEVLADVPGAANARELIVLSKSDLADPVDLTALRGRFPEAVAVSCLTGEGIDELLEKLDEALPRPNIEVTAVVPYSRGDLVSRIHEEGEILAPVEYRDEGTWVHARVPEDLAGALRGLGICAESLPGSGAVL
ncbi:MAG: GTPase HflX [Actinomycetaceae bacterium]|nr:GTPase HflX [Actinomycetaceae bacterium]